MNFNLTANELSQYSRQMTLKEIGIEGQRRLKKAKILYIGAGGLASAALPYLASAGIGTLGIVDDDVVEWSNLHRQVLYGVSDIKEKKVWAAQKKLQYLNPSIQIIAYDERLTQDNVEPLIAPYDLILDGSDALPVRYWLNDACLRLGRPYLYASVDSFKGQYAFFLGNPCYRCLFKEPPLSPIPTCEEGGVFNVIPGIVGLLQANAALQWILQIGKLLHGQLFIFDGLKMQFNQYKIETDPTCFICYKIKPTLKDNPMSRTNSSPHVKALSVYELKKILASDKIPLLIDVREPMEHAKHHLTQSLLIPLRELANHFEAFEKTQAIVIYCEEGVRSLLAAQLLANMGFSNVSTLAGGMSAWEKENNR